MKTMFQNVFKNQQKAKELFDANKKFFIDNNITNDIILNNLAKNESLLKHPTFFNFIK